MPLQKVFLSSAVRLQRFELSDALNCNTAKDISISLKKEKMTWFCLPFKFYFTSCKVSFETLERLFILVPFSSGPLSQNPEPGEADD